MVRKRLLRLLGAVLLGLLLGVVIGIVRVRLMEEQFTFFPIRASVPELKAQGQGLQAEDVFIPTTDGLRLHAWLAPAYALRVHPERVHRERASAGRPAGAAPVTILYFHGNAGNLIDRTPTLAFLQQLPANVLAVDYRGYGGSEGAPTEEGVYRDAEAAYDYLVRERKVPPEQVVVLGQSLGTAVAVDLATKRKVAGLILESGFPSARRVVHRAMGLPGLGYLIRTRFDSAAKLKDIHLPVLVAHCTGDPVIPYVLGEELYAAANQPKTFISYPGNCHEPLYFADPDDYAAKLRAFLKTATESQRHRE